MKVLFYGNCQLAVLSDWWQRHVADHHVQKIDQLDVQLVPFAGELGLFAIWAQPDKSVEYQQQIKHHIHERIRESDIFIFQDHSGYNLIDELKTQYIHDNVARGQSICVPDMRMTMYLSDHISLEPYVEHVKNIVSTPIEIIEYLQTSDDPKLKELLLLEYPINKEWRRYRNENYSRYEIERKKYNTRIDINDFVEQNHDKKYLAITNNHMSEHYFEELLNRILDKLDMNHYCVHTGATRPIGHAHVWRSTQFKFFRDMFPELKEPDYKNRFARYRQQGDIRDMLVSDLSR